MAPVVTEPVYDSPFPANIPVIRTGSPEFVALANSINKVV